jgi:hypothetical protein
MVHGPNGPDEQSGSLPVGEGWAVSMDWASWARPQEEFK